ncbi:unnamed protein product, partial [Mesorhabditis spiculigera]
MITRSIILVAALVASSSAASCGALSGAQAECSDHTLIVMDASEEIQSVQTVLDYMNFTSDMLLANWGYNSRKTQFSFATYGIINVSAIACKGYITYGESVPDRICQAIVQWKGSVDRGILGEVQLQTIATDVTTCALRGETKPYDRILLFTAARNPADIQASSWLPSKVPTVVVNLGVGDFRQENSGQDGCWEVTDVPTWYNTDTTAPPTGSPVNDDNVTLCDCDITKSWNDVVVIADSSSAMGNDRFGELRAFVLSALAQTSVGQAQQYQTRVGVVSYAKNAVTLANLTDYNSITDMFVTNWTYDGADDTNILGAVNIAADQLNSAQHRTKSRKVIILGASTYRSSRDYPFPYNETLTFKKNHGIIIVIAYGDPHGLGTQILKDIASPGFYIDATPGRNPNFDQMKTLLCNANCFCPGEETNDPYYQVHDQNQDWPSQGCYWDSTLIAIQPLVKSTCAILSAARGVPTMPKTLLQQSSVLSVAAQNLTKPGFYIGLTKQAGQWRWDDGSLYSGVIQDDGVNTCAQVQQTNGFNWAISSSLLDKHFPILRELHEALHGFYTALIWLTFAMLFIDCPAEYWDALGLQLRTYLIASLSNTRRGDRKYAYMDTPEFDVEHERIRCWYQRQVPATKPVNL